MAATETNGKSSMHIRCNSFPSASHPIVSQFEKNLNRLKSSEAASCSSYICHKLSGLQDLYDCTDNLLQLSTTRQALTRGCSQKSVDRLLEGSLALLDICNAAKDYLLQSKESIQELQSVIRRRGVETAEFKIEVGRYLASRKKMKRAIRNVMANLRGILKDASTNKDNETLPMHGILKEAEAVTVSSLESLLLFICDPKGQLKHSRWSGISKLMQAKRVACDSEEPDTNEFEKVDADLKSLISLKHSSVENIPTHLEDLEMCTKDLEVEVENLSRQLIKSRVSLLNLFNH